MLPTIKEFLDFRRKFNDSKSNLRFGQAFCNNFNFSNQTLFYTEDRKQAEEIIASLLLDDDNAN